MEKSRRGGEEDGGGGDDDDDGLGEVRGRRAKEMEGLVVTAVAASSEKVRRVGWLRWKRSIFFCKKIK